MPNRGKRLCFFCALALSARAATAYGASSPDEAALPAAIYTLHLDGTTNTWTLADLKAALQLLNRKYHRDIATSTGRSAWHGKLMRQTVDTNALVKIDHHEDGSAFTSAWRHVTAAQAVSNANRRLRTTWTNGVPAALAAARARRLAEKATTNIVNVTVTAGKN